MFDVLCQREGSCLIGFGDDLRLERGAQLESFLTACREWLLSDTADKPAIYIDCRRLRYVDSTGIGALVRLDDLLQAHNGVLYLVGVPQTVSMVFRMSGLSRLFQFLDIAEAKKRFPELA